jgi:hypothetical protein
MEFKEYFLGSAVGLSLSTSVKVFIAASDLKTDALGCGFTFGELVRVKVSQSSRIKLGRANS